MERSSLRIPNFGYLIIYEKVFTSEKVWFVKNKEKISSSDVKKKSRLFEMRMSGKLLTCHMLYYLFQVEF